jgi:hypothetical protein
VEPDGSLPCSQQPAIGPYPEPDESSPHLLLPISVKSILISFQLYLVLPSGLYLSGFSTKILYAFFISTMRATYPSHLILLDLITLIQVIEFVRYWFIFHILGNVKSYGVDDQSSDPAMGVYVSYSLPRPYLLKGSPSGHSDRFSRDSAAGTSNWHSPPCCSEVRNAWSFSPCSIHLCIECGLYTGVISHFSNCTE